MLDVLALFAQSYITAIMTTGLACVLAYLLFWKALSQRLVHWRIQLNRRADSKQIKRELKNSLFVFAVSACFSVFVISLGSLGLTNIYFNLNDYPIWVGLLGFPLLLIIDDTWFYWVHRALHHPKIYRHVHHEHHRSLDVNPITSISFHWIEPLLLTAWVLPAAMFLPLWAPALLLLQLYGLLDNIKSHLGYEIFPAWWNKSPLGLLTSSTYHNLHHTKFKGNYGVHFRFWDRLMGTELKVYDEVFDEIQSRKAAGGMTQAKKDQIT
ncbi:sterol desaturase family protein [Gymnodinialimonas hymeniacidonis]|uniref:sterol desaturase family protein n=1 Tax=Gymnodinialimonas hymeniacidonis TaxID=3126508 RepID=UPI0034C5EF2D